MPRGFFPKSKRLTMKAPASLVPKCGACKLFENCQSPKMDPSGKGRKKILIVGEFPGSDEDKQSKHFVGETGRYLETVLGKLGVSLRNDCILTNSLICSTPYGQAPTSKQLEYCRPNLIKTIERHQPEVIILLGASPVQSLLSSVYKDDAIGGIAKWAGWAIPSQKLNTWICPTFHPSYVLRSEKNPVPGMLFEQHLKKAASFDRRPWDEVPDYEQRVERIVSPSKAAKAILAFIDEGRPIAFDYEGTCLKPEYEGWAIVSCSISNGKRTIAYPWLGEAIKATQKVLRSSLPKIASNLKFEERWTLAEFGHGVTNWVWDTMVNAHLIDNRPEITSIKFQAFVLVGVNSYDEHIKPFLKARKGRKINQILSEIDLDQLLLYNGMDSLLELIVAKIQAKVIGVKF